jgi:GYF domain 2
MQWYVSQKGKTTGPFDEERLAMLVQWGRISRDAFICDKQQSAWIAIRCSAFARLLPAQEQRRRFGGLLGSEASAGGSTCGAAGSEASDGEETSSRQALGLVALSVILAGLLMATL